MENESATGRSLFAKECRTSREVWGSSPPFSAMHPLVVHCKREQYDVYVGRPTVWGNPYSHKEGTVARFKVETREEAIVKFEQWVRGMPGFVRFIRQELRGKTLGCWCSPDACHGEILARIANE